MPTTERDRNLNLRVSSQELEKLHALAADRDLSASTLIRHMLREAYAARFGSAPPPSAEPSRTPRSRRGRR